MKFISGNPEPLITGREKPLSPEEAFAILSGDEAAHDGETLKPFKARGGEVYLFNINNKDTIQNHLKLVNIDKMIVYLFCPGYSSYTKS